MKNGKLDINTMVNLVIPESILFSERPDNLKKILQPISNTRYLFCNFYKFQYAGAKVLAAHNGKINNKDFSEWYFPSYKKGIWCKYYELWKQDSNKAEWKFDNAYLDIFVTNINRELDRILCLHCEPNDNSEEPKRSFKKSPHIHLKKAAEPLSKSHIPLNYSDLSEILSSIVKLNEAFIKAITILKYEVIDRL